MGPAGPQGPPGISAAYAASAPEVSLGPTGGPVADLVLPEGFFVVSAKVQLDSNDATAVVQCELTLGGESDASAVTLAASDTDTLPLLLAGPAQAGEAATLTCRGAALIARNIKVTAVQVDSLNP